MYYLLINFEYTITDFHGDTEKNEYDTLLYFFDTYSKCDLKYKKIEKELLKKYNCFGKPAYDVCGYYFVKLDKDDINYEIDKIKLSEE